MIDNFVNPDTAIAKFSPKYLNDAQIKAVKQKIAEATTQEAIDQAVADGYALDDAMMKLRQSVEGYGGPSERMVVNTRNSDKYVYDTQADKDAYDQVAVEANKYLSWANGGYLDLNATQQLTQRVNDAWNALDGVKPTDSNKAADNAKYITHDQTVDWGTPAPQASNAVEVTNLPEGVMVTSLDWKETPVTKPNMKGEESVAVPATVHIEFSDGSSRDVAVNINVTSQSAKYTPETQDLQSERYC